MRIGSSYSFPYFMNLLSNAPLVIITLTSKHRVTRNQMIKSVTEIITTALKIASY